MALEWSDSTAGMDWEALSQLYLAAPLGHKPAADLALVFGNSRYVCFVREAGRLVAAGRVLADGLDCAYICDMAVHPSHQGQGLGRAVLADLMARARGHRKIILYAVPGKEGFYRRLGFRRMCTAMAVFEDQEGAVRRGLVE